MIVVIPARRGSKRFPDKNIKSFNGTNLTRMALRQARCLNPDAIVLSTDYTWSEVWETGMPVMLDGKDYVHYMRPKKLCQDDVSTEAVVKDAVRHYIITSGKRSIREFCVLQPTSPLRTSATLCEAKAWFLGKKYPALVSVNPAYQPNGCFYFCVWDAFLMDYSLFPVGTKRYPCDWRESVDIDYLFQFRIAEDMAKDVRL